MLIIYKIRKLLRLKNKMGALKKVVLILCAAVALWPLMVYASYTPTAGNNNDVQYKNGSGLGGSDNFVINGTNVGGRHDFTFRVIRSRDPKFDVLSGGNVGIGSITPGQKLDVNGSIRSTSGGFVFPDGSTQTVAASGGNSWSMSNGNVYTTTPTNNVGIGTTTPQTGFCCFKRQCWYRYMDAAGGALIIKGVMWASVRPMLIRP